MMRLTRLLNVMMSFFGLEHDRSNAGHRAEIFQLRVKVRAIAKASVLVGPMLKKLVHVAVSRHKTMRPERNATFMEAACQFLCRRIRRPWRE